MPRIEIHLKDEERDPLEKISLVGVRQVRPLQRAQVLLALGQGIGDCPIAEVLNIERIKSLPIAKKLTLLA